MSNLEQEKREYFKKLYTEDPAKHYVRRNGWLNATLQRVAEIRSKRRRELGYAKYFTLPGEYAIDVFLLSEHEIIQQTRVGFPGTVYCERRPEIVHMINRKLGRCMGVFADTFERAVFKGEFGTYCPFDIINLDLTKEIFPLNGRAESNTIRAIEKLLWLHKNREFDFYVTFKSSPKETNPDAVREFEEMITDNFGNNKTLETAFNKHCGAGPTDLRRKDFTLFWCKSFPKWILETGLTNNVVGSILNEYVYLRRPRYGTPYHIVTFLFSFARKKHGYMSKPKMVAQTIKEILKSFTLIPCDVDEHLRKNIEEKRKLKNDVARISNIPPKISKI